MKTILKFVFLLLFFSLTRETLTSANCFYNVEYISPENINELPLKVNNAIYSANMPPSGSFTFLDKQCSSNHIQFSTSTAATAPYSYFWDFGDTFSSTVQNPTHKFTVTNALSSQTFNVTLTITDTVTFETTKVIKAVTVVTAPDPTLNGTGSGAVFNGMPAFQINTNAPQVFTFTNGSTTIGTNTKYTINWGDGSSNFSSTSWTTINHTYPIGTWNALYTIEGPGCTTVQPFIVFIGLKPTVILGEPAKIDPCDPGPVVFPILGTRNNPLGTTYTVSFNDGSPDTILNHPPPPAIAHSFKKSSCGVTSKGIMNSFYANIVAANPSGTSESFVVPLYISTPLTATCTLSSPITCTNTPVCVENTSKGGVVVTAAGCEQPKSFWIISPSVGVTLASGIMGNNNGSTDPDFWTPGSEEICPQFSLPGKYTITYNIGNSCGVFNVDSKVCVEEPLVPDFTLDKNIGCIPTTVNATSTTNLTNTCTIPKYKWDVSYTDGYCGTFSSYTVKNDSTPNASFEFKSAGIYHVKLSVTNSCGLRSATKDVIISMPPTVKVDTIPDFCGTASIIPKSIVNSCAPASATINYFWEFPGGIPATSNIEYPGPINYSMPGTYDVKLYVTTACGASALSIRRFTIHEIPTLTNTVLSQTVCSNVPSTLVTLTADKPAATFGWTATATPGITGFMPLGTGNTIPVQTIITTSPFPGKVTYTITPSLGTCPGTPVDYVINVIPQPILSAQPVGDDVCLNGTPKPLTVGYIGPVDFYQWYSNATNSTVGGTALGGFGANTFTYNPSSSTVGSVYYYCVLTIPGACTTITSNTAKVTVAAMPGITTQPTPIQTICVGGSIPTPLTVVYTGGAGFVTYQWYSNTTNTNTGGTAIPFGGTASTFTPLPKAIPGTEYYYLVVSFTGSNCTSITSNPAEVITVADPTVTDPLPATQPVCQYETPITLSVTASGGIGALYNYQWYSNTVTNNIGGTPIAGATGHTYVPSTNSPGTLYYYCEVKQPGGCEVTSNYAQVDVVPAPTYPPLAGSTYCLNDTPTPLVVTVTGGSGTPTFQWYSNTSNSILSGTKLIGETLPIFTPSGTVSSTTYYYCEITFPTGTCLKLYTNIAKIIVNDFPQIANATRTICSGDAFTVAPTNTLPDVVPLGTTYTWTVTTSSGSVTGESNQPNPVSTISQTLTNNNTSISQVAYHVLPIAPGGCLGNLFDIDVTVQPAIVLAETVTDRSCFGVNDASIVVAITGGNPFPGPSYDIKWTSTTGPISNTTNVLTGIAPGDYTIEVTDATNCKQSAIYTVTEPADMKITTDVHKNVSCFGSNNGEIKITVTGGTTPYQYFWTNNGSTISGNSDTQMNLGPGNYEVTVMDANSCTNNNTKTFTITEPAKLLVSAKVTQNLDCVSANSGAIDLTVSGGLAPYTYAWSNGQMTEDLINIPSGNYAVVVTDANGCTFIDSYVIIKPLPINISMNVTNEFDCTTKIAFKRSEATVTGGFPPYTLSWSGGIVSGVNKEIMTTTASGPYTLHVVDSLGCTKDEAYTITVEKPGILATIVDCRRGLWQFNAQNANVAGDIPYSYAWDFGDGSATSNLRNPQHTYAVFGKFTVKLTIVGATCTTDYTKDVEVEPLPVLKFISYRICEGDSVTQTVTGNFKKKWSDGSTGDQMVIKQKGDYSVICMSPNGCLDTLNFSVLTDLYNYTIMTDREEIALDGKPLILWSESIPFSQYSWEFGDGTVGSGNKVSHEYTVVQNGGFDVTLTVINPYGCKEVAHKRVWIVNNKDANTFTPNGDGINDVFMPGWHLKVYNRNGILLYEGSTGWDGKYQGQLVSKDTYYYVMDYLTESGAKFKDGYVMVIR